MSEHRRLLLLVEDDEDVAATVSEWLEEEGFIVARAPNGKHALEQLRGGLRPSAILLDLVMPEMDGWQFRKEQVADPSLRDISTVVFTAAAPHASWTLTGVEVIRKPIDADELVSMVRRISRPPD